MTARGHRGTPPDNGADVGSILLETGAFCRFINQWADRWADHVRLDGLRIIPLTEIGGVTGRILGFNDSDRLLERQAFRDAGRYPTPAALQRIA